MFMLEGLLRDVAALPSLAKVGLVVMVVSGLADVIAHLEETQVAEIAGHVHHHTTFESSAHLGGFVSMVLILAGVVSFGVQRSRARRPAADQALEGVA